MFSVSPAEILTIALVALVVFGPKRLPEISRKAGKTLRDLKAAAEDLRRGIETEVGSSDDLGSIRREMQGLLDVPPPPRTPTPPAAAPPPPPEETEP